MVVGVSTRADSVGGRILRHLLEAGYTGEVYPICRDAFEVQGLRAYARIGDVPAPVDLAVIALNRPEACLQAIDECGRLGVRSAVIPTDAFAGSGEKGAALQRRLITRARRAGIRVLGPGSFGFLRTGDDAVNLSLSPRLPRNGSVALAGQSSALSAMLLAGVDERGIGVHEFVTVGNRADVSLNDTLQHWQDDPDARVLAVVLESMGNPRKFTRIAGRITRERPLVVLRPPGVGITAPPGHDVRPSTLPRRALDQVLSSAGVVRAEGVDHLLDVVDTLSRQGVPPGPRVGLLSNTPALGEAMRGSAATAGLRVVKENHRVPLGTDERFVARAFTSLAALGEVDVVVAAMVDPLGGDLGPILRRMAEVARGAEVVLVVCVVTDHERFTALAERVRRDGTLPPVYSTPARAVRAAAGALAAAARSAVEEEPLPQREDVDPERARGLVRSALGEVPGSRALSPSHTRELLGAYGLHLLPSRDADTLDEALAAADAIGYPVALKSRDPALRHRSDLGGVRLDLADALQLRHAFASMRRDLAYSSAGLEVQAMAPPGVPVVVRTVEDPSVGPVISFSVAGDATDLLDDIAYAIPPLGEHAVRRLIDTPATSRKLRGGLGLPPADREALAEVLVRVGLLAEDLPELRALELYPVVVGHESCTIVGARVEIAHAPNRTDGLRRSLNAPGGA
jgi:acyl-CoA synthetase (NDP forming)